MADFTGEQKKRYSRHIALEGVGLEGQAKIKDGKVLIIGVGGLGSPVALYLSAAGVGEIGIADSDSVDLSNLQRQVIHSSLDVGSSKVESAARKMRNLNPDVKVTTYRELVRADTIRDMIRDYNFIVDGTDNFRAKFLINDAAVMERKPFCHGGVFQFEGQAMTVVPGRSACLRCAFDGPPAPDISPPGFETGVLGPLAGMLGAIQATETLKFLMGVGEPLVDRLLIIDAGRMSFQNVALRRRPSCPVCGDSPTILKLVDDRISR